MVRPVTAVTTSKSKIRTMCSQLLDLILCIYFAVFLVAMRLFLFYVIYLFFLCKFLFRTNWFEVENAIRKYILLGAIEIIQQYIVVA